jgi:hypothetical protein
MKKTLVLLLLQIVSVKSLVSQTHLSDTNTTHTWTMTGGVHFFTKQIVRPNYQPLAGLNIYSKPTFDYALEVTRFFKLKKNWSSSIGFRSGFMPSNQGVDIAENITRNGFAFDDYDKGRLPYVAFKGLVNLKIWEKKRLSIQQSLGSSFVLVPHGYANYSIISISTGTEVPYLISKGFYNPNSRPFLSGLSETSLICTKRGEKKWTLNLSFEIAPKDVIQSNYVFYTKTEELKGTITRRYQQMGLEFGWFWTTKKKKKRSDYE